MDSIHAVYNMMMVMMIGTKDYSIAVTTYLFTFVWWNVMDRGNRIGS